MHSLLILLLLIPTGQLLADSDTLSINIVIHDVVAVEETLLPETFALHPPYPNPFNPDVKLEVDIAEEVQTRVSVFNLRGQEVALLEDRSLTPGRYAYHWRAKDQPAGIYFVRIQAGSFEASEKISLLK